MNDDAAHLNFALTADLRERLADASRIAGKPWSQVLTEALAEYSNSRRIAGGEKTPDGSQPTGGAGRSAFDHFQRTGFIGALKGAPSDLASNPIHMEGFGTS